MSGDGELTEWSGRSLHSRRTECSSAEHAYPAQGCRTPESQPLLDEVAVNNHKRHNLKMMVLNEI